MRNLKIIFILIMFLAAGFAQDAMHCVKSFAQEGAQQQVEISGYDFNNNLVNMLPVTYGVVVSKRFNDTQNAARWLDPSGDTRLESLRVMDGITLDMDEANQGGVYLLRNTGSYFINFNDVGANPGYARFRNLQAFRFIMDDDGPLTSAVLHQRGGGKFVWDIAEAVLVREGEPGDVVVISNDEDITLVRSKRKYDTAVAGVISSDPKIYMGYPPEPEKDNRYKPLTLAGVVLCNVSTENGPIKRGDILVSSSLPGHAMRADPEKLTPGMILGCALDSLDQGEGKILILVN